LNLDSALTAQRAAVRIAAATLAVHDPATAEHAEGVAALCRAIADRLEIQGADRVRLIAAAQLSDIGKVSIPREVLDKEGPLTEREWQLVRRHTIAGEEILRSVAELNDLARVVRHTHERYDGAGYPDGLVGEEIPLASRIVFCADAFNAIRSDRPYRPGSSAPAALAEVRANAGAQFDPLVVQALEVAAGDARRPRRRRFAPRRVRRD
jgi:HD-GYP domain-containing protein (c-di-GMP phosphodiesterase class II)